MVKFCIRNKGKHSNEFLFTCVSQQWFVNTFSSITKRLQFAKDVLHVYKLLKFIVAK